LPPQVGIYGYLLGGLGYALLGSSRQLAVGPTSAISLMIASTVSAMADGDAQRYAQIASLAAFTVAALCLLAWALRLSALVKLISDSILVGFKAGAGLTIAMTQLPSLLGVGGGGHNFFERAVVLAGQLDEIKYLVLIVGIVALVVLVLGERLLPGRPKAFSFSSVSAISKVLPSRLTRRHRRYQAPLVSSSAIGATTASYNCFSGSAPTRVLAWEIPDLPATFTLVEGSSNHCTPSSRQRNTSR